MCTVVPRRGHAWSWSNPSSWRPPTAELVPYGSRLTLRLHTVADIPHLSRLLSRAMAAQATPCRPAALSPLQAVTNHLSPSTPHQSPLTKHLSPSTPVTTVCLSGRRVATLLPNYLTALPYYLNTSLSYLTTSLPHYLLPYLTTSLPYYLTILLPHRRGGQLGVRRYLPH